MSLANAGLFFQTATTSTFLSGITWNLRGTTGILIPDGIRLERTGPIVCAWLNTENGDTVC